MAIMNFTKGRIKNVYLFDEGVKQAMKKLMIICLTVIVLLCGCGQEKEQIVEEAEGGEVPTFLVDGELISYEDTGDGNCVIKLKVWSHGINKVEQKDVEYAEITTTMKEFGPLSRKDETQYDAREILPGDYVECWPFDWEYELKDNTLYAHVDYLKWEYADRVDYIKERIKEEYGYDVDER